MSTLRAEDRDAVDLRRGVRVNLLGYIVKAAHPVLFIWVIRQYGAAEFGLFTVAQVTVMLALRLCLIGIDKGLLWWIPRTTQEKEREAILPALMVVAVTSSVGAIVLGLVGAGLLQRWVGSAESAGSIPWMAAALLPMAILEIFTHSLLGKRRTEAQVVVREGIVPISQVVLALVFYALGLKAVGLELSFVIAQTIGAGAAGLFFRHGFRSSRWPQWHWQLPPSEMMRYAIPLWLAELLNTTLLRLDVFLLAHLSNPKTLGIYAAAAQIANVVRSIRQSFDPIVIAIFSQVGAERNTERLVASFSRATSGVIWLQLPVGGFIIVFAPWLMELFGPGFEAGAPVLRILTAGWIINGVLGLNGMIILGFGRGDIQLWNICFAIMVETALLFWFIPVWGVSGAALAVAGGYFLHHVVQYYQARSLSHVNVYDLRVLRTVAIGCFAWLGSAAIWFLLNTMQQQLWRQVVVFGVFGLIILVGWLYTKAKDKQAA